MQNKKEIPIIISDDLKFLIACCQSERSVEKTNFILNCISEKNTDYLSNLIALSLRHCILPLVYRTIKEIALQEEKIPSGFVSELKANYMSISPRNMLMSTELIRIIKLFRENNIKVLAFKGPILSQIAYGDITLRQYSDLDIFVEEAHKQKVVSLLLENGYVDTLDFTPEQKLPWYSNAKEINLYHPEKSIHIDLQWLFFDKDYPLHYDYSTIWENTSAIKLNNHSIPTFSPENLLIYLSVHGAKHLFERIGWIKDIDLFIRIQPIDWQQIDRQMDQSDFKRMFLLGLSLSRQFFNTPIPEKYIQEYKNQPWLRSVNTFIVEEWIEHKNFIYNTMAMLKLFPATKQKLGYLNKVIFKPSKNEYRFVALPDRWHWAYYFIRPFLLLKKYLISS